jgi:isochorismate synthase
MRIENRTASQTVTATQLLEAYSNKTSFFFASPIQTLSAQGISKVLPTSESSSLDSNLSDRAMSFLKRNSIPGTPQAVMVGAIPFNNPTQVRLFIPQHVQRAERLYLLSKSATETQSSSMPPPVLRMLPEPDSYRQGVEQALQNIQRTELQKVVLSRSLELVFAEVIPLPQLLHELSFRNHHGYTFVVDLGKQESSEAESSASWPPLQPCRFVGASPELLVRRTGLHVTTNPRAGSTPRSGDLAVDRQRAEVLLSSEKNRREHAVVVEAVAESLRPYCRKLDVPAVPSIVKTDTMIHLSSLIRGTLKDPDMNALSLALSLHPTLAICGSPVACAHKAICDIEPFERRYFSGMVGWVDAQGDGEWAVSIRCAETEGCNLRLYAGAGIVAGSTAEQELAETSAKFRTMLRAMGLDHLREAVS